MLSKVLIMAVLVVAVFSEIWPKNGETLKGQELEQAMARSELQGKLLKMSNLSTEEKVNKINEAEEQLFDLAKTEEQKIQIRKIVNAARRAAGVPEKAEILPTWAIVLIVIGCSAVVVVGVGGTVLYCKRKQ